MAALDGDDKALIRMRKLRQQQAEGEDFNDEDFVLDSSKDKTSEANEDWKVVKDAVARYARHRAKSAARTRTAVQAFQDSLIDINQMRAKSFKAVDDSDLMTLQAVLDEVSVKHADIKDLHTQSTGETLLIRLVNMNEVNEGVFEHLLRLGDDFICTAMKVSVEGKKTERTALHFAAEQGHIKAAKKIISSIQNQSLKEKLLFAKTTIVPEGQRPRPLTGLHIAAKKGYNELVKYFVETCKMDVNLVNQKGDTPILWAANDNRPETVSLLISMGADVNTKNDKGSSALHWACRNGHTQVVKVLLSEGNGLNVDIQRDLGLVRPVIAASAMGFHEIVKMLVEHGADIGHKIHDGQTAMSYAASEGHLKVIIALMDGGADVESMDDSGNSPILNAAMHEHTKVVLFLADCGANLSHRNLANQSAWDFALHAKSSSLLKAMVRHATKTSVTGNDTDPSMITRQFPIGITPLHSAATLGDVDKVQFLLDMKIDAALQDGSLSTFLHVAATHNQCEILKRFAEKKLCAIQDDNGNTPMHIACEFGFDDGIKILLPKSDVSIKNNAGQTVLHLATKALSIQVDTIQLITTEMILHHEWTVLHSKDSLKRTALHMAVIARNTDIIPELHQLDVNEVASSGYNPLHHAVMHGELVLLDALLKTFNSYGKVMDLDCRTGTGETALHMCIQHEKPRMIKHLVKAGADLVAKNAAGRSVLHEIAYSMALNPQNSEALMEIFEAIVECSVQWWARKIRKPVPAKQADEYDEMVVDSLVQLFDKTSDDEGYSATQYAALKSANYLLVAILNLPGRYRIETLSSSTKIIFDVTGLMPDTLLDSNLSKNKKTQSSKSHVAPAEIEMQETVKDKSSISIARLLVDSSEDKPRAAEILESSPMKNLVQAYWTTYQRMFGLIFIVHIIYMALFSYFGVELLKVSLSYPCSSNSSSPIYPPFNVEVLLLFEPVGILIYYLITVVTHIRMLAKLGCAGYYHRLIAVNKAEEISHLIGGTIIQICGFLFAVFAIAWLIAYRYCYLHQDYLLAISYILGWFYSIQFTRGFKQVHNFTIMLQNMLFKDVFRFALVYSFILFAFAFAYHSLIQAIPTLRTATPTQFDSLFLVFNWMIGMADFEADQTEFTLNLKSVYLIQIIYSIYIILTTIVMLNLLIAMMSDSYATVKSQSAISWTCNSIQLAIDAEQAMPFLPKIFGRFRRNRDQLRMDHATGRWLLSVPVQELTNVLKTDISAYNSLNHKINQVQDKLVLLLQKQEKSH